jgi:phosphoglycerate dehydrogenase-like enzyme
MGTDLKRHRVLVTPTSYGKTDPTLRSELEAAVGEVIYNPVGRPLTAAELRELLPSCDGYIAGLDEISATALDGADRLKVIARYGVGVDNVDLAAASARGIVVTNTPQANAVSVAELTVGLILSLARSIPLLVARTRAGEWPRVVGTAIKGKTVGLLGMGAIGKEVVRRLRGFDCALLAHDPRADEAFAAEFGVQLVSAAEVGARSDFLSLHLPLLPTTRGTVNAEFLATMKPGAFLINTSRGEIVDEQALYAALTAGHIRGAALDVFGEEPPSPGDPLLVLPEVLVTPHTGAHSDDATGSMGWGALRDCLAVLRGDPPTHRVGS